MIQEDCEGNVNQITTRNPQANAIVERVHATIGDMIRSFGVNKTTNQVKWTNILSAVMFAVRTTVHTTLKASPAQLVFGRDAILRGGLAAD
mgnify:CR=1 FL=1